MTKLTEKKRLEIANFRFGLIAPALNQTFTEKSESEYFERLENTPLKYVDGSVLKVKKSTLKTWKRMYVRGGFDYLIPKVRSDAGHNRKIDSELASTIQNMRSKYPCITATSVYETLIIEGVIDKQHMSVSTMQRFFKNNPIDIDLSNTKKDRRAFEAECVNYIWQADSLYGPYIDKKRTYLQAVIDDKSRKIVSAKFYYSDSAINFQKTYKRAISTHGIPKILFLDNGAPYRNEQLSLICGSLSVDLIHAQARDSAAKGKIERFNRTLRMRFLNCLDMSTIKSINQLNEALNKWIDIYNDTKHSSTNKTPTCAFLEEFENLVWFSGDIDKVFLNRCERKVASDATIHLNNNLYDVPMGYIGQKIKIRWDIEDINSVWMESADNKLIKLALTDKIANSKAPRKNNSAHIDYSKVGR